MGFGSYDESEQQNREERKEEDQGEGITTHQNDHDGELTFESESSTEDLLEQLEEIKDGNEDE